MNTPGSVEILRAVKKDEIFIDKFHQDVQEVAESLLGQRNYLKWRKWVKRLSIGCFYSLTNLLGAQTLGEEYAGLLQVDSSLRRTPSKLVIAAMIILHVCGESVLETGLKHLRDSLASSGNELKNSGRCQNEGQEGPPVRKSPAVHAAKLIDFLRQCLPFLTRLHLVMFYLRGQFYHISKRSLGIHYILVRKWFANQNYNSKRNLKYLRLMSGINLAVTAVHDCIVYLNQPLEKKATKPEITDSSGIDQLRKCSLCLEVRKNPSLTTCGHLFCWECIMDWLQTKEECPICRTQVTCSRVVPLQNHV